MPSFDLKPYKGEAWRLVEAQHRVSTMKLVDDADEQILLEEIIEDTKPKVPPECRHLHYLLFTPFRYGGRYPSGSRFRRAGFTAGVWYGAEAIETAVAELAFYRLLFFLESPDTRWPANVAEFSAFSAHVETLWHADIASGDFDIDRPRLEHLTDYAPCQALADELRKAGCEVIRYRSARDPQRRANIAVLTCEAFAAPDPVERQTWRLRISSTGIFAISPETGTRLNFGRGTFASDPRIAAIDWDR